MERYPVSKTAADDESVGSSTLPASAPYDISASVHKVGRGGIQRRVVPPAFRGEPIWWTMPTDAASLTHDGDFFTVTCQHATRTIERTHDPIIPENDEYMTRYALQRHSSLCEKGCTIHLWMRWFEQRRQRFLAEGNTRAHG